MCDDQAEVDRYVDALGAGGTIEPCGWLRDRYGVSWQVVPKVLLEMMRDPDRAAVARVSAAVMKMKKLDIATLERAFRGEDA